MKKLIVVLLCFVAACSFFIQACTKESSGNNSSVTTNQQLSQFGIFTGTLSNLTPSSGYTPYSVASSLFVDYAEKQRLIKVPAGTQLVASGDGLPQFPDGTVIVKTFYYYNDASNPALGKKIIETRLLQLTKGVWNVSTYKWRDDQSDADLVSAAGDSVAVNFKNTLGVPTQVNYHIPSITNCKTCHYSNGVVIPIGPKARNLNFNITVNGSSINQLAYLSSLNILSYSGAITSVPNYNDTTASLAGRARAYLDINCAHCHNASGYAASTRVHFDYDLDLDQTGITSFGSAIETYMQTKQMPLIGTTLVDTAGVALVKKYIDSL